MTTASNAPSKRLHHALWAVQALAAVAFLGAGMTKATKPLAELAVSMAWVPRFLATAVRAIGVAEVLGALGLVLPTALRRRPRLTPAAAVGLLAWMLGAVGTHFALGELSRALPALVLVFMVAFVAWGRGDKAAVAPRS